MIELKLRDVVGSYAALGNLMGAKLPIKAAYHLKRLAQKIEPDIKNYNVTRDELLKELGTPEKNKDGVETGAFKFDGDAGAQFEKQLAELLDADIKIDLDLLSIDALGDKAEVSAADLFACDKYIGDKVA